ncbi:MAG: helix-turn-helix domain-containing protein [Micropruina sp.]|uniref:helix-turn-helix domain-containing protein n=1 Tax=Micropruina sp. TaxID=2737536 RepID=UPI0039E6E708
MARNQAAADARTFFPEGAEAEIVDFVQALAERGILAPTSKAALVAPDNSRIELPEPLHAALVQVAEALMQGMAVSVIPQSARLTTQQAAEFLGVSRPTLVRLLERGEIPMSKPGRHRYVQLQDLVAYQRLMQARRREILDTMAREAAEAGLYVATDGPRPVMR